MKAPLRPATIAVHAGSPRGSNAPLTVPVVRSTAFRFDSSAQLAHYYEQGVGQSELFLYSRDENPTVRAAEQALAALEGADGCIAFASGMGAMSCALFGLTEAGSEVLASSALYGGTFKYLRDQLSRFGVRLRQVAPEELAPALRESSGVRLCVFETPTNPTLRVVDVAAVAEAARAKGVVTLLDATFSGPAISRPLSLGVDVVMHSTTKFLNGHSDRLGGALLGGRERIAALRKTASALGATMDPDAASDLLRGLKTYPLRVERASQSALAVARWLSQRPGVSVSYPGLDTHPDHALAARTMATFGAMVTLSVGTRERALRFWDRLGLIARAASLGGVETLASLPVLFSHRGQSPAELARGGVDEGMIRLSIGLEAPEDLIADLGQALEG